MVGYIRALRLSLEGGKISEQGAAGHFSGGAGMPPRGDAALGPRPDGEGLRRWGD